MTPDEIRELRREREWTQAQLAFRIEVSVDTVRSWEQGTKVPNAWNKIGLSRLAGKCPMAISPTPPEASE